MIESVYGYSRIGMGECAERVLHGLYACVCAISVTRRRLPRLPRRRCKAIIDSLRDFLTKNFLIETEYFRLGLGLVNYQPFGQMIRYRSRIQ